MGSISAANAEFCFDVFKEVKFHHPNDNIIYCPLSMIAALAMVYLGARNNTEHQMEKVSYINGVQTLFDPRGSRLSISIFQTCLAKEWLSKFWSYFPLIAYPHEGQEQSLVFIKKEQFWRMVKAGVLLQLVLSQRPDSFQVERTTWNIQKTKCSENNSHSHKYNAVRLYLIYG